MRETVVGKGQLALSAMPWKGWRSGNTRAWQGSSSLRKRSRGRSIIALSPNSTTHSRHLNISTWCQTSVRAVTCAVSWHNKLMADWKRVMRGFTWLRFCWRLKSFIGMESCTEISSQKMYWLIRRGMHVCLTLVWPSKACLNKSKLELCWVEDRPINYQKFFLASSTISQLICTCMVC